MLAKTLSENVERFNKLGCMPRNVNLSRIDEGDGLENTLFPRKARWHESCFLNFNSTKLQRAEKRKTVDLADCPVDAKYTRSSFKRKNQLLLVCAVFVMSQSLQKSPSAMSVQ